ncbi:hypothetical protein [Halobacteriovorax sp. DPLXC-1]|uniref:hypothetical protein n=1 Tax=Halobacteriovorax sp. DPLXC-1 TaxID=3110771 RepID=UPI002FF04E0E
MKKLLMVLFLMSTLSVQAEMSEGPTPCDANNNEAKCESGDNCLTLDSESGESSQTDTSAKGDGQ